MQNAKAFTLRITIFPSSAALLEQLQPSFNKRVPEAFAVLDLELTRRFLDYGADLLAGRRARPESGRERVVHQGAALEHRWNLRGAAQAEEFQGIVAPLRPQLPGYADLVKALAGYREILEHGGWPKVPGVAISGGALAAPR